MPLIRQGKIAEDRWIDVADDAELPAETPAIISLKRWQSARALLIGRPAPLGIRLKSDQAPALIAGDLKHFALVALEFPKFTDGRAYSHARLLRERLGFTGELRAVGNVLRDQLRFMQRCGFDSYEIAADKPVREWLGAFTDISYVYQPTGDGAAPAYRLRQAAPTAPANDDDKLAGGPAAAAESDKTAADESEPLLAAAVWAY